MASIYTVTQVTGYICRLFEEDFALNRISIQGEISNCKIHGSGHIYFTLKDQKSTLSCVMFASHAASLRFSVKEGMEVIVSGSIRVYQRDGRYQLYVVSMKEAGIGDWYAVFEERKKYLEEMGLFAPEYKKPIPEYAKRVGIVTADTGAAIQDMIQISARRNPYVQLILYPAYVQGKHAPDSIVRGIETLDRLGVDCIIVGRGGGSIEDLWAFNEEKVAMAIFQCETPIISAVGHETDFTIADFVADLRAPTPSAAAELAVFEYEAFEELLEGFAFALRQSMQSRILEVKQQLGRTELELRRNHPRERLAVCRQELALSSQRMKAACREQLQAYKHRLAVLAGMLEAKSPLARLRGGYAFLTDTENHPMCSVADFQPGTAFIAHMEDGKVRAMTVYAEFADGQEQRGKQNDNQGTAGENTGAGRCP